ncbi:hypothetical protein [Chryseobacterium sp. SG20098]|uniref:hypothetical protein n=1 Tax=Chryseobacterium sp. SG20098 TaxID=3074145 RepID=UPI002882FB84|nr:hypothetical protein [Chryseobacterium sp. SG20098]WNI37977.1 hypothetical protein RHP76_05740 [Chryseobacterium sp. SG20098]
MKFKILLALIFVNLLQAQKFYFPKTAVNDSVILEKQIPGLSQQVIPLLQSAKYKPENTVDLMDNLFRLQLVAHDYKNSLASLFENRKLFADHNMGDYRYIGFELYALAKMEQEENDTSFSNALQKVFNQKYESLPEKLIPRLELALNGDVNASRKLLKNLLDKQKDKDSIDYKTALALCKKLSEL